MQAASDTVPTLSATDTELARLNAHSLVMRRAFDLVCPRERAMELLEHGLISRAAAETVSWKGAISALVTQQELDAAGVTAVQVAESIEYFTATTATVTEVPVAGKAWERFDSPVPGYLFQAAGYRAGPAGDH